MKSLTAMQIPEVVVFNQAPADWTGVLGYRSSAYFFSYHKYSQYLVSPKAAVEVVRTLASSRELFKNCTYMTMMEENDFGRWGGYSPEESAQLSVAKGGDVSNAAWAESDDAYEENFAFATLKATTATVTAMTEAIFTPAVMAIESTEVNYPVLLGASMAVLFVFLILLILMEMLRRKNRRRRRRSGGGSRLSATSSMASRSNVASKSAIGSRSNISSSKCRTNRTA